MKKESFPVAIGRDRYVVIYYEPEDKAYSLDRNYNLLEKNLHISNKKVVRSAIDNHVQSWSGWVPSCDYQKPEWALNLKDKFFTAYWVAV